MRTSKRRSATDLPFNPARSFPNSAQGGTQIRAGSVESPPPAGFASSFWLLRLVGDLISVVDQTQTSLRRILSEYNEGVGEHGKKRSLIPGDFSRRAI